MSSPPAPARLLALVLVGVLSATLGLAIGWRLRPLPEPAQEALRPPVSAPPVDAPRGIDGAVAERLERLDARLAALEVAIGRLGATARTVAAPDPTAAEDRVAARLDELLARLGAMEDALARLEQSDERAARQRIDLAALKEEHDEVQWPALRELLDLRRLDPNAASREVQLLSDEDLVRRFGSPTTMYGNAAGLHWFYRDGDDDVWTTEVYFRLQNGYVTVLDVAYR